MTGDTRDPQQEEPVEGTPSFDDLADVLTGTYRVNRVTAVRLDSISASLTILSLMLALLFGVAMGFLYLKVEASNG